MRAACLLLLIACVSCQKHEATIELYVADGYEFSRAERDKIQTIADATVVEVRKLLPALPSPVIIRAQAGQEVIDETGETASALQPNIVSWIVDPQRPGGVQAIAERQLRATLFHEFHHLVRGASFDRDTIMDDAITEGMATAFERDYAKGSAPWGEYPDNAAEWAKEVIALPETASREEWMFQHPDGRRWIGYKVGTYLVDRAVAASGKSPALLVSATTEEIIALAMNPARN